MNFFGHVVLARGYSVSERLRFGAMLPDFAGMIGAASPLVRCPQVRAGVGYHYRTDEVFHRTAAFRRLSGVAARHLEGLGLGRGSALAVGHVGVELLIDCALGRDAAVCEDYLAALRAGAPESLADEVEWASLAEGERYEKLHAVLVDRGLAVVDPAPEQLARRIQRALSRRPRLAFSDADCDLVAAWARGALSIVVASAPELIEELRAGLACRERVEAAAR